MKLLSSFKKLPQGYYRILIVGWFLLPLVVGIISAGLEKRSADQVPVFFVVFLFGIPIYYVLARFLIWIRDGFSSDKNSKG